MTHDTQAQTRWPLNLATWKLLLTLNRTVLTESGLEAESVGIRERGYKRLDTLNLFEFSFKGQ